MKLSDIYMNCDNMTTYTAFDIVRDGEITHYDSFYQIPLPFGYYRDVKFFVITELNKKLTALSVKVYFD